MIFLVYVDLRILTAILPSISASPGLTTAFAPQGTSGAGRKSIAQDGSGFDIRQQVR
jgi:hypothetical protein